MKRQTLLLVLVAVMSLAGATEAFCQRPQRSKVRVQPKMDYRVKERAKANLIEEFLAEHGPHAGGNPGPFLPGAELDELVTDIMVDILLEQQFSHRMLNSIQNNGAFNAGNYNYDVPVFNRRKPENRLEGAVIVGGLIIIVNKDHPLVVIDIDDLLENPAEYEGADGDDTWDVLQRP